MHNLREASQTSWIKMGIGFGTLMFLFKLFQDILAEDLTSEMVGINGVSSMLAGLVFGLLMKLFLTRKS